MSLTEQQERVVNERRSNILVSAAAGSGKTRVLVERIAKRIISGDLDVRNVLVMTFTRAAAAGMSARLEKALSEAAAAISDPAEVARINEQVSMIPLSHISTIHSFCGDVIQNFRQELTDAKDRVLIEPDTSIADETRAKILLRESVVFVTDALYALCHRVLNQSDPIKDQPVPDRPQEPPDHPAPFSIGKDTPTIEKWCESFMNMSLCFGSARDDQPLKDMVVDFHSSLRSLPDYEERIRVLIEDKRREAEQFSESATAKAYIEELREIVDRAKTAVHDAIPLMDQFSFVKDPKTNKKQKDQYLECFATVSELSEILHTDPRWDDISRIAARVPDGKWPGSVKPSEVSGPKGIFFESLFPMFEMIYVLSGGYPLNKEYIKRFKGLMPSVFSRPTDRIEADLRYMYPILSRLFETIILTDRLYSEQKRAENSLDFSDQEHMALTLLKIPEVAQYYRALFTEIYIDEYQDNSRIQDAIIREISSDNVFYVGDVKQSIYRFRHARPDMFLERSEHFRAGDGGKLLELTGNFRSQAGILLFANDIFSQLMSRESAEIDYDESQRLQPKKEGPVLGNDRKRVVNITLIDRSGTPGEQDEFEDETEDLRDRERMDFGSTEYEALYVLERIREMQNRYGCRYEDFAVLCRTNRDAAIVAGILSSEGVPAHGPVEAAMFADREMLLMYHLMCVLDNLRQDVPLCAVMRSCLPSASFSPEELLEICLCAGKSSENLRFFHEKVMYCRQFGPEPLKSKIGRFFEFIDGLMTRSMYLSISELIESIYLSTGIMDRLSSEENGFARVSALLTFREWASDFEKGRKGGLYSFVRYIEEINRGEHRPDGFEVGDPIRDAVRCNSIHKSKGLEYRIVFLCGISKAFSHQDEAGPVILNDRIGLASDYINAEKGYKYPTIPKMYLSERERRAELAEQLRLFYVAMTRAEERLYLIGSFSRRADGSPGIHDDFITVSEGHKEETLPPRLVLRANSFLDFLLLGLSRNPFVPLRDLLMPGKESIASIDREVASGRTGEVCFEVITVDTLLASASLPEPLDENPLSDPSSSPGLGMDSEEYKMSEREKKWFDVQMRGEYPFEYLIRMPAKTTVSEMKRRPPPPERKDESGNDHASVESEDAFEKRPINLRVRPVRNVRNDHKELSATETGILLHNVFQYLDFSSLSGNTSEGDIRKELKRLVERNMIRPDMLPDLESYLSPIAVFANSDLCARMKKAEQISGHGPFREIPFSITEPVSRDDFRLIQGMIDCWFIENGRAVLIDYKSDKIRGDRNHQHRVLRERYSVQLEYYKRAIEAAGRLPVKEKIIWLIPDSTAFLL